MEAEFDRPWWQPKQGARYKRLKLDTYAGDGVGDDALANNCAKILDGLLRQELGIAAGSFFSHAVRAANGMLPQSVIQGIDYVRQQRNDVMHTLGIFRLQDPDRFASCVNAALDAIEAAAAAGRRSGAGAGSGAPPARGGGSLASGGGRRNFQLTTAGFAEQQLDGTAPQPSWQQQRQGGEQREQQKQQQQQQQGEQQQGEQQHVRLASLEADRERQRQLEAARWAAEVAAAEREADELQAVQEASRREAERQRRDEADFEAQLAAALQASLQQQVRQGRQQQGQQQQQAGSPLQPRGEHAPAAQQRQPHEVQLGPTPLRQEVVDLTADSDGPPAKRRRCCEAQAGLDGQPLWAEGSPCEIILIGSQ